jgi:hypothetical protein
MDIFFCGKIYEAQRSCSIRTEKHNSELRDAVSGFWVQRINFSIEKFRYNRMGRFYHINSPLGKPRKALEAILHY